MADAPTIADPMSPTDAECTAMIGYYEGLIAEYLGAPEKHNTGKSGYDAGAKKVPMLRQELDRWQRRLRTMRNGGVAIRTQRGCGAIGVADGLPTGDIACGCGGDD